MAELFRISDGPWTLFFTGEFQGNKLQVFENPDKLILVAIFEQENEKVTGAVLEFYKILVSKTELADFLETFPKEAITISKHSPSGTLKFLIMSSSPTYVEWKEEAVLDETEKLLKNIQVSSNLLKDVGKAYDLQLMELKEAGEEAVNAFFSQPLMVPLLASNYHPESGATKTGGRPSEQAGIRMEETLGNYEAILGLTADKVLMKEPLQLFKKVAVLGENERQRKQVLQILTESMLLANIPVIVWDWNSEFLAMGNASKNRQGLLQEGIKIEPIGFPLQVFEAGKNLQVNINELGGELLAEEFGLAKEMKIILDSLLRENPVKDMQELIGLISGIPGSEEIPSSLVDSITRCLKLISSLYPDLFGGELNVQELSKQWFKSIGRLSVLEMQGVDERGMQMLNYCLLKALSQFYDTLPGNQKLKSFLVIPSAEKMTSTKANLVQEQTMELLEKIGNSNVGMVLETPHLIDIHKKMADALEARFQGINEKETAVYLIGKKTYRVQLRETLSEAIAKKIPAAVKK